LQTFLKQNEFFIRIAKGGRVQITARRVDTNAAQIDAAFTRLE
jgi:hypothetical protein